MPTCYSNFHLRKFFCVCYLYLGFKATLVVGFLLLLLSLTFQRRKFKIQRGKMSSHNHAASKWQTQDSDLWISIPAPRPPHTLCHSVFFLLSLWGSLDELSARGCPREGRSRLCQVHPLPFSYSSVTCVHFTNEQLFSKILNDLP